MNLSPDPQLASINSDLMDRYDKLLLKETKTHNENVELKSKIEELKEENDELEKAHARLTTHFARNAELEEEVKELQTTIHNIKKIWLDEDDENFDCIDSVVMAMEDNIKDRIIAEEKVEILEGNICPICEKVKTLQADKVYMEKQFNELKANSIKCFDDLLDNTNREIAGLKKENEELKNRWRPPLGATNFGEVLGEKNDEIKKLKKDLKTFKDAVVEALGGPEFNGPYKDCIRLRDITCEIGGLKEQVDRLREKLDIASKEHLACLDKINTFYEKKEKDWEEQVKDLKLQMKHEDGWTPDWAYEVGDYIREIEYLKKENEELKKVVKSNRDLFDASEKDILRIKGALTCDDPDDWTIDKVCECIDKENENNKKIAYLKEQLESTQNSLGSTSAEYEKLVDKNNNDNLNFGDILFEREEEIKRLTKTLQLAEDKIKDLKDEEFCADCDKPHKCEDCVKESDDDCRPDAWDAM